ncbi:MAG: hypothetical protein R3246_14410, partial [Acidimicrobiia bacterium]|nr:hypothetical protein [Acidimicrobiia bacterium]
VPGHTAGVGSTPERVQRLVTGLFGPGQEQRVVERLARMTGQHELEGAERVHAAVVLASHGDFEMLEEQATLADLDWRDVLVVAGLARAEWEERLDRAVDELSISRWDGPLIDAWEAWTPWEIAERLDGLDIPWCIVGGWAIDLALGETTRPHEDLEIAVPRRGLAAIRQHLGEFVFHVAGGGEVRRLDSSEETPEDRHQHWVLDMEADRWRVDVMAEPGDDETWVYRRNASLRAPRTSMVGVSADGVPYLRLHGTLLFKAKATRPKDRRDFDASVTSLDGSDRRWLMAALERFHPGHPWIHRLV